MFLINDHLHFEHHDRNGPRTNVRPVDPFGTFEEALAEVRRRASVPYDLPPNLCPCGPGRQDGRDYQILEWDDSAIPWQLLRRVPVVSVRPTGVVWASDFKTSA